MKKEKNNMEIKKLSEYSFEEAVQIYNASFENYIVNKTMTLEQFISRFGLDNISPENCIVGVIDGEPVGLVRSGIKMVAGKKFAWNGGTGVVKHYRGQGIGTKLMNHVIDFYKDQNVELATLESFSHNDNAVSLYKKVGYQIVDKLITLENNGSLEANSSEYEGNFTAVYGLPQDVQTISFYDHYSPWQNQCTNIRDGLSLIVKDQLGEILGYSLYKRLYDNDGLIKFIILNQCHAVDNSEVSKSVIHFMLDKVFNSIDIECMRMTFNLSSKNQVAINYLESKGFFKKYELVYMHYELE
jgi:GNAT superfamily N-acetyltransferase